MLIPARLRLPQRQPWLQRMGGVFLQGRSFATRRGLDSSFDSAFDADVDRARG
jgi:hypothetical protein